MKRRKHDAEREFEAQNRLFRAWKRWHAEELQTALLGPHGPAIKELIDFLRGMTLQSAPELIRLIRRRDWRQIDVATRQIVLHQINIAVVKLRERHGLNPFDDGLPDGQRPTAFLVIKQELGDA